MADTTLTGAEREVIVDTATEKRKTIIKYVVIAVLVAAAAYVIYKYVIK